MKRMVIAYKNVYERTNPKEFNFFDFIDNAGLIFEAYGRFDYKEQLNRIKSIELKEQRNDEKRNYIPAVDLSLSGILSIDIDNIFDKPEKKQQVINRLKKVDSCYVIQESVSGNIVAYFKYECSVTEFKFLYYKLYLELVLKLSVNIDFLPEVGRLRYVSTGEVFYFNEDSEVLTEILEVDDLPYINTSVKKDKARTIVYGSR